MSVSCLDDVKVTLEFPDGSVMSENVIVLELGTEAGTLYPHIETWRMGLQSQYLSLNITGCGKRPFRFEGES